MLLIQQVDAMARDYDQIMKKLDHLEPQGYPQVPKRKNNSCHQVTLSSKKMTPGEVLGHHIISKTMDN